MKYKQLPFAEIRLYIGSVRGYKGQPFSEAQLTRVIQEFQQDWKERHEWTCAVRMTKTSYVCLDYQENGWEVSVINYPRFPRPTAELEKFMKELREFLMIEFSQNRISMIEDYEASECRIITMAEKDDAEQTHR
jgi:hypothetical protein